MSFSSSTSSKVMQQTGVALVLLAAMLWGGAMAQSGCTTLLVGLTPCLNYVSGNASTPSSTCCSSLSSIVQTQPRCLCSLVDGNSASLGVTINQTRALELPSACQVQTPPVSKCKTAAGPTASTTVSTPALTAPSPSDTESKTTGKTSTSGSMTLEFPLILLSVALLASITRF